VLVLLQAFDDGARQVLASLDAAGIKATTVVIGYDGDLPDGALCPLTTYTGLPRDGKPLFFNDIPVPPLCEIRQDKDPHGLVLRDGAIIGHINYEPNSFRIVESVDWLASDGAVASTQHFDRYGNHYASTYYADGAAYQTSYHGPGRWIVDVNHASQSVIMRSPDQMLTFASMTDFVTHFLADQGIGDDNTVINSLHYPWFVMRERSTAPHTTLIWQEPMPGDIPGNMRAELENPRALSRIVVSDQHVLDRLRSEYPNTSVDLTYLSPIGQIADHTGYDARRCFTLTNSDDLPWLETLLAAHPSVTFSVAALTLMSDKLHGLARSYPNLLLTPTINQTGILDELAQASVYLDINAGAQVLDAVTAAYRLGLLVMADGALAKTPANALVYDTVDALSWVLGEVTASAADRKRVVAALHTQHGPLSTVEDYRRVLR
jgi:accessory Sec system glycosyltransferase GtfB